MSKTQVARPPQLIALAFDNCGQTDFWRASRQFAQEMKAIKIKVDFTYFLSGVYFLSERTKQLYHGPRKPDGSSEIGFATNDADLLERLNQIQSALNEGHEIGSHAVGHFDGSSWSAADWEYEFSTYLSLLKNVFKNNQLDPRQVGQPFKLLPSDITGFRTPYLAVSAGTAKSLSAFHFRYDTSLIESSDYWPKKINVTPEVSKGYWNFPLAILTLAGTNQKTISMDYNFYMAQSNAEDDLGHAPFYEQQMVDTYMQYFLTNYHGNRAPLQIGHHFSQMNGGAYWRAMKRFAREVCSKPEVKCVTYSRLADFMDKLSPETLAAYQAGKFKRF